MSALSAAARTPMDVSFRPQIGRYTLQRRAWATLRRTRSHPMAPEHTPSLSVSQPTAARAQQSFPSMTSLSQALAKITLPVGAAAFTTKKDQSSRVMTERAVHILTCVRNEARMLQERIIEAGEHEASLETFIRAQSRLETLSIAMEKVKRNVPEVVELKRGVLESLESIGKTLEGLRGSLSHLLDSRPVEFSSGIFLILIVLGQYNLTTFADAHINSAAAQLDVIPQVALFLGVVCSAVVGVSRRAGDLIFGLLNILLSIIFCDVRHTFQARVPKRSCNTSPRLSMRRRQSSTLRADLSFMRCVPIAKARTNQASSMARSTPSIPSTATTFLALGATKCGAPLLEAHKIGGLTVWRPVLTFAHHELNDYICGLECREDLRKYLASLATMR